MPRISSKKNPCKHPDCTGFHGHTKPFDMLCPGTQKRMTKDVHERKRLYRYGITHDQFVALVEEQGGQCVICNKTATHLDHDHVTGKVRGVLCDTCNAGIGFLGDNIEGLERALTYLRSVGASK